MKTYLFKKHAVTALACVCLGIICCTTIYGAEKGKKAAAPAASGDTANLVITRSPSVGSGIFVAISLDGNKLVTLTQGRRYSGTVPAGKHVITCVPDPNLSGQVVNKTEFTAEKGQTYAFTATRKSGDVVLMKAAAR